MVVPTNNLETEMFELYVDCKVVAEYPAWSDIKTYMQVYSVRYAYVVTPHGDYNVRLINGRLVKSAV